MLTLSVREKTREPGKAHGYWLQSFPAALGNDLPRERLNPHGYWAHSFPGTQSFPAGTGNPGTIDKGCDGPGSIGANSSLLTLTSLHGQVAQAGRSCPIPFSSRNRSPYRVTGTFGTRIARIRDVSGFSGESGSYFVRLPDPWRCLMPSGTSWQE